ncbi:MAG TPA: glutathione S-transferase family protein, partial [Sphingomonadaceae bacterium]|nr:glutathione S-transferase family protein [Sphingomonadaceae bacterium]
MLALYGHPFSSYTWKGLIPLYATGVEFEFREVGPDEPDHSDFVARSHPGAKFPVLVDGDTIVIEATAIVEHLALKYPASNLIPTDPAQAAITRMLDRVFDNYVMGSAQLV